MKKGRLTKAELYYIQGNSDMKAEDIAKDLDRSVELIKKNLPIKKEEKEPPKTTKVKNEPPMLQKMGRHSRNGENIATVMTQSASEYADATREQRIKNTKIQEAIFKPRG